MVALIVEAAAADRRGHAAAPRHRPQRRAASTSSPSGSSASKATPTTIHAAGLKKAFQEHRATEPMQFIVAREIFKHLERITDAFEDVANEIDGIVIDHA